MTDRVLVGVSGWAYRSWRGDYYPAALAASQQLGYVSRRLPTVELNASFYSLRDPGSYERWHRETPPGFVFSVKGGRYVTHIKRLRDPLVPLANFFASGVLALDDKLGPILWQLPATLPFDADGLRHFIDCLPSDTADARRLAGHHTAVVEGRTWLYDTPNRPLRHALEVRHASFGSPSCLSLLREHGIDLVVSDGAGRWPMLDAETADFVYVRLHGHEVLYGGGYPDALLRRWRDEFRRIASDGKDVYVYFDNDSDGRAPYDAERLRELLYGD